MTFSGLMPSASALKFVKSLCLRTGRAILRTSSQVTLRRPWKMARAFQQLKENFRARTALQQLIVKHPQDPRRAEAEKLLAALR